LATECDFAGVEAIGQRIFEQASEALEDRPPPELLAFYRSYRACVRAKVAALRAVQQSADARRESYAEAVRRLQWAERYDRQLPAPFLLVACGLMGSGKSTLAGKLAEKLGAEVLATDAIRREVFGESKQPLEYGAGHYSPEDRTHIYDRMFDEARKLLRDGLPVILDGAFLGARSRTEALQLADSENAAALIVHCRCPEDVARERIAARLATGKSPSEARPELYGRQREDEEPDPAGATTVEIDTTAESDLQIERVIEHLQQIYTT
jgi:predicted kinase